LTEAHTMPSPEPSEEHRLDVDCYTGQGIKRIIDDYKSVLRDGRIRLQTRRLLRRFRDENVRHYLTVQLEKRISRWLSDLTGRIISALRGTDMSPKDVAKMEEFLTGARAMLSRTYGGTKSADNPFEAALHQYYLNYSDLMDTGKKGKKAKRLVKRGIKNLKKMVESLQARQKVQKTLFRLYEDDVRDRLIARDIIKAQKAKECRIILSLLDHILDIPLPEEPELKKSFTAKITNFLKRKRRGDRR